eukprot:g7309.t1
MSVNPALPRRIQLRNNPPNKCKILYYIQNELVIIYKPPDIKIGKGGDIVYQKDKTNDGELTVSKLIYNTLLKDENETVDKIRWIHRLDMATSGALCVGLSKASARIVQSLFETHKVRKVYVALIKGTLERDKRKEILLEQNSTPGLLDSFVGKRKRSNHKKESIIDRTFWTFDKLERQEVLYIDRNIVQDEHDSFKMTTPKYTASSNVITSTKVDDKFNAEELSEGDIVTTSSINSKSVGRIARTKVKVLKHVEFEGIKCTKVVLIPITGRRHQLRVHMKSIGHPILGDYTYDREFCIKHDLPRMYLQSKSLKIPVKEYKYIKHRGKCKDLKLALLNEIHIDIEDDF